ncbi:3-hydroxybutyrate dehydrogenase [Ornithinibacillus scapharcae]|uniref:3-hydroxybutyrate dehydrogenase n=1 Tax=Ornithinibacillus scapharcae TaxID=1147159 RepID=UPI000225B3B4|nr:3-hydroxybutyrate dehydrogenase [Ornithinibacillus scapharcae]
MVLDKIIFITGAASGIGFAIGKEFAKQGAKVVLTDINTDKLTEAVSSLKEEGNDVIGMECDVLREEQIVNALNQTVERYGRLDVLINNAGMQFVSPIEEFPTEVFEKMINMMLVAPFITTKHILPTMKKHKSGRIINMASINGLIGFAGKAAYNSAKHGLIGLTKVSALEAAEHGITVNAICPGYVDTVLVRNQLQDLARTKGVALERVLEEVIYPLVPQKRLLDVEEIANYVLFLSSDQARGVTGQAVVLDGGYTAQ